MKKFLTICSLFVLSLPIFAQQKNNTHKQTISKENNILIQFDQKRDETSVYIYPYSVVFAEESKGLCSGDRISMTAGFDFNGKVKTSRPEEIEFGLRSKMFGRWKFIEHKQRILIVIADGEEINLGAMKRINAKKNHIANINCSEYLEDLALFTSTKTFERIANSKKAVLKIGDYTVKLDKSHRQAMRNLFDQLVD
ncbi:MAG: hypothetical protein WKF92_07975 [Pyrinomonadaceae bacterium]